VNGTEKKAAFKSDPHLATKAAPNRSKQVLTTGANVKVTAVKASLRDKEMLRAYVDIVLDDCLAICDLRIIHGSRGHFVAMPSKPLTNSRRADITHLLLLKRGA
jgi:DNA-binding cell septation regulator SpoVG